MSLTPHTPTTEPKFAVSTWSLHRTLGVMYADKPGYDGERTAREAFGKPQHALLEIPAKLAAMGVPRVGMSHFHLPSRERSYCDDLKHALSEAGVEMFTLLVEDGGGQHIGMHAQHSERFAGTGWILESQRNFDGVSQRRGQFLAGAFRLFVSRLRAEPRLEPEVAQDPQVVLADALAGIADEPHAPGGQIVEAAEPVLHFARVRIGV